MSDGIRRGIAVVLLLAGVVVFVACRSQFERSRGRER